MQSIELKMVFTDLPELAAFIGSMPNVQLALSQPAAELRVAHEPVQHQQQLPAPAPVHHATPTHAPQHVQTAAAQLAPTATQHPSHTSHPSNGHNAGLATSVSPSSTVSIPEIKKLMVSRLQGLNGHAKLSPDVLRGLFARHQVQSVDFLQPHQLDGFHMELQNL